MSRRAALSIACLATCVAGPAPAQIGGSHWRADDRVLVSDFGYVTALARSTSQLFAATSGGLLVNNDVHRRWEPPLTREDGWPDGQVTAMAFDRLDRILWIAVIDGRMLALDPHGYHWTDEVRLGRTVERIVPDGSVGGGLLLRTGEGWIRYDPFTGDATRASAAEANDAITRNPDLRARRELLTSPGFESVRAFVGTGPDGRLWPITDVMPADDPSRFWIATAGAGLSLLHSFSMDWRPVEVGMLGSGASAVAIEDGDTWIAPLEPNAGRYGITRVSDDLETWQVEAAGTGRGVPDRGVSALLARDRRLWTAGERGVQVRDGSGRWSEVAPGAWNATHRLAALALGGPVIDGESTLWVGGARGLDRLRPGAAGPERVVSGTSVAGIFATRTGVWAATDRGLLFADTTGLVSPAPDVPAFPAGAVTGDGVSVWVGVGREIWVRASGSGSWRRMDELGALSSAVTALAIAGDVLWIGTQDGLVSRELSGGLTRRYTFAGGDLPLGRFGERGITAIAALSETRVWIATPAGALRIDDPY